MTKRILLLLWMLICSAAAAEQLKLDTLKAGATVYKDVTVLGANTTDLYFRHANGFANVKLKYLSPALQKRFDYNPKAAEEAEKRQNEAEILYQTSLRASAVPAAKSAVAKATGWLGTETGLSDPISDKSPLGKTAPELSVEKWLGDKPDLEGKFVLISFWASWSAPCRQYIPELNALQKKYGEKLVIVGVTAEPEKDLSDFAGPRLEYASAIDTKAKLTAAAGVTSIPCVLLADPKGVILYQGHPAALTEKRLQTVLSRPSE
jgi:cytochrome c biogenesis protein CcmG, thiol:disulfide interchange protein DsbE